MASGKSGYVEFSSSVSWGTVRIYYVETYDIETNTSDVKITYIKVKSTNWYGITYYPDGLVKVNGKTAIILNSSTGTHTVRIDSQGTWATVYKAGTSTAASGTVSDIKHESDGSKSVSIQLTGNRFDNFSFFTISGNYGNGWNVGASKTIALTTIPRASTIVATAANIGEVSTLTVTRKSTSYTHSIQYEFGSVSGYIKADGSVATSEQKITATSIGFTVPTSFYAQIPSAVSGTCTLTIKTYSGSTQIGSAQTTTFKATAAKSECAPSVSGTVVDTNEATVAVTGDSSKLVRYMSNALCTISATAKNSATIASRSIGGTAVTESTRTISAVETGSIAFVAKDSRGYSTSVTVKKTLIAYIKLTANVLLTRDDPTSGKATLSISGDYFNSTFGSGGTKNTISIKYRLKQSGGSYGSYQTVTAVLDGNTYSVSVALTDLDYEYSYTAQVVVADALSSVTKTTTVSQGIPVFDWGEKDFRFNLALLFTTNSYGSILPTENLKKGQIFFLKNSGDGFAIRIYDGSTWL